jgi:hypothetical protein
VVYFLVLPVTEFVGDLRYYKRFGFFCSGSKDLIDMPIPTRQSFDTIDISASTVFNRAATNCGAKDR